MPDRTLGPVEAQIRALREKKIARGKLRTEKINELQQLVAEIPATKPRKERKWRNPTKKPSSLNSLTSKKKPKKRSQTRR